MEAAQCITKAHIRSSSETRLHHARRGAAESRSDHESRSREVRADTFDESANDDNTINQTQRTQNSDLVDE